MNITFLEGDVLESEIEGPKILAHCCNDKNGFGSGVAGAIARRWPNVKTAYHQWFARKTDPEFRLGAVLFVPVPDTDILVANIIGQHGYVGYGTNSPQKPPVRYEAIEEGMCEVGIVAYNSNASIIAPRLGCGLAGGRWSEIEKCLTRAIPQGTVNVYIYDPPGPKTFRQ